MHFTLLCNIAADHCITGEHGLLLLLLLWMMAEMCAFLCDSHLTTCVCFMHTFERFVRLHMI